MCTILSKMIIPIFFFILTNATTGPLADGLQLQHLVYTPLIEKLQHTQPALFVILCSPKITI